MNRVTWPRSVLITGAGSGLGLALATALVRRGALVLGLVRRPESAAALQAATADLAVPILGDVTDPGVETAIRAGLAARTASLDLLVNNAGAAGDGARLAELDPAGILHMVDLHCNGALRCTRAALPALRAAERAVVVNVSSRLGSVTRVARGDFDALSISYATRISKAALNMATACLARELTSDRIVVHSIHPGRIRTRMASADADLSVEEAAGNFLAWLDSLPAGTTAGYWDTGQGVLPW